MHDPLGVEPLQGPHGLPVVAELAVVVVLKDQPVVRPRPVHERGPALRQQRAPGGELVARREEHRVGAGRREGDGAVGVEREHDDPHPGRAQNPPVHPQPVRLDGDGPHPALAQAREKLPQALG
ncbi:hypothetical protein GA0115246_101521, partial [Streptomyces sp. SolWspMP-sol7th]